MDNTYKLHIIKLIHTVIWLFFVTVIFYIVYCGITGIINVMTWIAIGMVLIEGLVLVLFKMFCPLTLIARKYSDSMQENFDIYLPQWLARHNKLIFTSIYVFGVLLVLLRVMV